MTYLASLKETTEDKIEGYTLLKTKRELNQVISEVNQVNKILFRQDFVRKYFNINGFERYLAEARRINRNLELVLEEEPCVITMSRMKKRLSSLSGLEELMYLGARYGKEVVSTIIEICSMNFDDRSEIMSASTAVSTLCRIIDEKDRELVCLLEQFREEQAEKLLFQSRLETLIARMNRQNDLELDENKLFSAQVNNYEKILYIKELTRVQFVDSLVFYLSEISKLFFGTHARRLVIECSYGLGKLAQYDGYAPYYALTERDVISGDIIMLGMQPKLMEDILKNGSKSSLLIVLDRGGCTEPHISGYNVEYVYTASDLKDVPDGIAEDRIISYHESTLHIPYIHKFDEMDLSRRAVKYSSLTIVRKLLSMAGIEVN